MTQTKTLATSGRSGNGPPAPALISLREVARRYTIGPLTVTALEDVTLDIGPGEFVVVLGPSGSGKTTLLNLVGALDSPTGGRIRRQPSQRRWALRQVRAVVV